MKAEIKFNEEIQVSFPNKLSKTFRSKRNSEIIELDISKLNLQEIRNKLSGMSLSDLFQIKKIRVLNTKTDRSLDNNSVTYNNGDLTVSYLSERNSLIVKFKSDIIMSGFWKCTKSRRVSFITKLYL